METPGRIGENRWIDPGSNTDPTIPTGMAASTHEKRPAKTNIPITASVAPSIHRASILARAMHGRWHGFTARVEASAQTFGSFATLLEPRALTCGRGNVVMQEESTDTQRQACKHCNRSGRMMCETSVEQLYEMLFEKCLPSLVHDIRPLKIKEGHQYCKMKGSKAFQSLG